jgi:basic amino acid/polyamine antiporter, APA family
VHEGQRDKGLVRSVTSWGLAATIINTVVGAGIFAVPADLAKSVGIYAPFAFLICAVAIGAVAICWAEGGSRVPTSGGAYGYIETAFGPFAAYIAGTLLWFGNALGSGGVAAALADIAASLLPRSFAAPAHAAVVVCVLGGIAAVNTRGASRGARLCEGLTLLKTIPLAVFLVAGAAAIHRTNFTQTAPLSSVGLGRALILALFAFTGMEGPLSASGEVAHPAKTIPRALAMAMPPVILFYVAVQVIAQGTLGSALPHSGTPLADAMAAIHPALRILMLAAAAVSMFGFIGSDILGTPRMLFAFAREGMLPGVLGRVHPETQAPQLAILCYAALCIAFASSGTFAELAVLSTLAVVPIYILGSAAAWILARRGIAEAGPPLKFRHLTLVTMIAVVSMLILSALASRAEIFGLFGAVASSALSYAIISRLRKP